MIREVGERPEGVRELRRARADVTEVWLGERKLFELTSFQLVSATEIVINWDDLERFALPAATPPAVEDLQ